MPDKVTTLKIQYNKLLKRWNDATNYMESEERTQQEIDKWLPEYEKILMQRNALSMDIWKYSGVKPTAEEFEGGFKIG